MNNSQISSMSNTDFFCLAILIAVWYCAVFGNLDQTSTPQPLLYTPPANEMVCPDIQVKHFVGSNLKTGVKAVDACAESLNVTRPWEVAKGE